MKKLLLTICAITLLVSTASAVSASQTYYHKKIDNYEHEELDNNIYLIELQLNAPKGFTYDTLTGDKYLNLSIEYAQILRDVLNSKGYALSGNGVAGSRDTFIDNAKEDIFKFSEAGAGEKSRMIPYVAPGIISLQKIAPSSKLVMLVQLIGEFDYESSAIDVVGVYATTQIATGILAGYTTGFSGGGTGSVTAKISLYDMNNGLLIWYREGVQFSSNNLNVIALKNTLEGFFEELPDPRVKFRKTKFKIRRSQIEASNKEM
jgi:hypothetical protein